MGLLDEMHNEPTKMGLTCGVAKVKNEVSEELWNDLTAALADHSITGATIARVLSRHGINLRVDTIRRHRNGGCKCE